MITYIIIPSITQHPLKSSIYNRFRKIQFQNSSVIVMGSFYIGFTNKTRIDFLSKYFSRVGTEAERAFLFYVTLKQKNCGKRLKNWMAVRSNKKILKNGAILDILLLER